MIDTTTPRIYVACLAAYNNGKLHGEWIAANQSAYEMHEAVKAMLASSPEPDSEEWAIHDYEGFHGLYISESESFERVAELAEAIEEHGEPFGKWLEMNSTEDISSFEEQYMGTFSSVEDYAEQYLEDCGTFHEMPEMLRQYFDFEAFARDLELGGEIWTAPGGDGVYVFRNE